MSISFIIMVADGQFRLLPKLPLHPMRSSSVSGKFLPMLLHKIALWCKAKHEGNSKREGGGREREREIERERERERERSQAHF